jgi:phenylalanyl-tRNA synthetase beta subunit
MRRRLLSRPLRANHPQRQVLSLSHMRSRCRAHVSAVRSIGVIGAIHPVVAANFSVPFACSGLEMDIERFSVKK